MSPKPQPASKFTFDVEFRPEGDLVSNAARARQRKVYAQDEIDHMCTKARSEGVKAGQVRAAEAVAAAIDALEGTLRAALTQTRGEFETLREEAAHLAFAAARKLAPIAIASFPAGDVEEAMREAMHQAIGEPRIVLRAAQNVIDALGDKLAAVAHEEGYEGRIVATADPTIAGADCRIEWRGGGAERTLASLETAVGDLIARRFSQSFHSAITKG
jgi:flagellar assembly protein FliH